MTKLANFTADRTEPFLYSVDRMKMIFAEQYHSTGVQMTESMQVTWLLRAASQLQHLGPAVEHL